MHKISFFLSLLLLGGCSLGETPHMKALKLEAGNMQSREGVIHKDVVYKSTLFHDVKLDIYEPLVQRGARSPVYIYIHGGSWIHGDKSLVNLYPKTVYALREAGITVVSIDYRFVTQSGVHAMVSDCLDAVVFLKEHAQKYHLDTNHIGLHGHSAGANLALVTGLTYSRKHDDILFIVDEYGPTDAVRLLKEQKDRLWWTYLISDSTLKEISPILMLHPKAPPVYIAHGDHDETVPLQQSTMLYEKLQTEGIPVSLHIIKGADHSYEGVSDAVIEAHRKEVLAFMLAQYGKILPR